MSNPTGVTEAASVSADLARRFAGLDRLYGVAGSSVVRQAHVAVVGIGGVGSWAVEALARSGVGRLTLIDMDHIAESNVNRQVHALTTTLGMAKIQAMRERIEGINPHCVVQCLDTFVDPENWPSVLPAGVQGVIDACDQMKAKVAMAAWALRQPHIAFISVGAAGGKRFAHKVDIDDLSNTTHDPLMAQLRYQLRKVHGASREGKKIGLACVFSREPLVTADVSGSVQGDGSLNCHGYGSLVTVTATFGLCAAGWMMDKFSNTASEHLKKTL